MNGLTIDRYRVRRKRIFTLGLVLALLVGCAAVDKKRLSPMPLASGTRYVSLGSSYAAGPGVTVPADTPPNRCARSSDNYAHQLAKRLQLSLVDVACSGATTAHILGKWNDLPAQIDAVTQDTRLVTITIGGNDVSFVRNLIALACQRAPEPPKGAPEGKCPTVYIPNGEDWTALATGLDRTAQEVRHRAPQARLVFVQYLRIVPAGDTCGAVPIDDAGLAQVRGIQRRLASITTATARKWRAIVIDPVERNVAHDPCSSAPWATGFPTPDAPPFVPFHPNHAGMGAIANLLARTLKP
jgi:lysophospholipase L1-like esterase